MNIMLGRNWVGDDILELAHGAGYYWLRKALLKVIEDFKPLCQTLIMTGHVKDNTITLDGKDVTERDLSLLGKTSAILASHVDAIGYVFREENKTNIRFVADSNITAESRSKHLRGQIITVAESDENNNVKVNWDKIFIE